MRSTIRHLDVVRNPLRSAQRDRPFLVCIQHDRMIEMKTRIIANLVTSRVFPEPSRLHPAISVEGNVLLFDPTDLLTLPVRILGSPVANLAADRDRIVAALDLVFTGV
jgi:toxin CcdB